MKYLPVWAGSPGGRWVPLARCVCLWPGCTTAVGTLQSYNGKTWMDGPERAGGGSQRPAEDAVGPSFSVSLPLPPSLGLCLWSLPFVVFFFLFSPILSGLFLFPYLPPGAPPAGRARARARS